MNDGNTRLRMTLKINIGSLSFTLEMFHLAPFAAKNREFAFSIVIKWR